MAADELVGDFTGDDPKKETPNKWTPPKDARKLKGAGTYPNYYSHKTRSGHVFMLDDSKGAESVTLQHRSGSCIQMNPNGSVVLTTHNGKYEITFGEDRVVVTGAQDIHVKGDASWKIDGHLNMTVAKNYNLTVNGNMTMTAKNLNQTIRGNIDTQAKNRTEKVEGSSQSTAQGAMAMLSEGGMTLGSKGDTVAIGGRAAVNIYSPGQARMRAGGKLSLQGGSVLAADAPRITFNNNESDDASTSNSMKTVQAPPDEPGDFSA
jgi:hypothetical protein